MSSRAEGRIPLVVGNWKMYKTSSEGAAFVRELVSVIGTVADREVMVAPPFTGLAAAIEAAKDSPVHVAAQDVYWEREGAFTGEVSPSMLASLGVRACVVGHSERRRLFGETDEGVGRKAQALLAEGLWPIVCVGEDEAEREKGDTTRVLERQVRVALSGVDTSEANRLVIAYEPVWAIGTGRTASPAVAQEAILFIRELVGSFLGGEAARCVRILYGGSVTPDNIDDLMAQPDIDGVLVGGASLRVDAFSRIVRFRTAETS